MEIFMSEFPLERLWDHKARIASAIIGRYTELALKISTWSDPLHFLTPFLANFAKTQTSQRNQTKGPRWQYALFQLLQKPIYQPGNNPKPAGLRSVSPCSYSIPCITCERQCMNSHFHKPGRVFMPRFQVLCRELEYFIWKPSRNRRKDHHQDQPCEFRQSKRDHGSIDISH